MKVSDRDRNLKGKNVGCVKLVFFFVIIYQPKNMFHEMCSKLWIHSALSIWLQYIIYIMQYDETLNMWPSAEKDKPEISEKLTNT